MEFHRAAQKLTAGLLTTEIALSMKLPLGHHGRSLSDEESPEPITNDQ
jgi:hypothetical protein